MGLSADEFAIPADEPDIEEDADPADLDDYDPADVEHDAAPEALNADAPAYRRHRDAMLQESAADVSDATLQLVKLEALIDVRDVLYDIADQLEAELTGYKHGTEVTRSYGDLGAEVAALRARVAELEQEKLDAEEARAARPFEGA